MCNEIFTTENMNEIVTPIYEAMKAGNPVAKLVFDLNDAINALKPGRPISKAERDRIEFMWDNLLVGLANETIGEDATGLASIINEAALAEEIEFGDKDFDLVLYKWYKAYKDMTIKAADKSCKESDKEKSKLAILSALETVVPEMSMSDLSELTGLPEQLIIDTVSRKEGAEEAFIKQIKPVKAMALIAVASNVIDIKHKKDEDKCSGDCKCKCTDKDDNDDADVEEMVDALKEALEMLTDDDITIKVSSSGKTPMRIRGVMRGYMPDTGLERIIRRFFGN